MLSRWIRSLSHWAMKKSEQDLRTSCTDPRFAGAITRMQEVEEKGWWRGKQLASFCLIQHHVLQEFEVLLSYLKCGSQLELASKDA